MSHTSNLFVCSFICQLMIVTGLAGATDWPPQLWVIAAVLGALTLLLSMPHAGTPDTQQPLPEMQPAWLDVLIRPTVLMVSSAAALGWFTDSIWSAPLLAGIWCLAAAATALRLAVEGSRNPGMAAVTALCALILLPLIGSPVIALVNSPALAAAAVYLSPAFYVAALGHYDLMYSPVIYNNTPLADLRVAAPDPRFTAAAYFIVGAAALAVHLRRTTAQSPDTLPIKQKRNPPHAF